MNYPLFKYSILLLVLLIFSGCRQAKYVPEGNYLLKDNEVKFQTQKRDKIKYEDDHPLLDAAEIAELVKPKPNQSFKLFFYNRIDTTRHKEQMNRKTEKYRKKNEKRKTKENRINNRRVDRAAEKGDSLYRHKTIQDKEVKLGWREWVRSNFGQPPVLLDTFRVTKSRNQIEIYLRKKGFYEATVTDTVIYKERKRKAFVAFVIEPGEPHRLRNFILDSASMNRTLLASYKRMLKVSNRSIKPGDLLDQDALDDERELFSKYCRNESGMFGFNKNYIGFLVDTTVGPKQADITLFVKPRIVDDPNDSEGERKITINHMSYRVKDATFYLRNPDTASFKNYAAFAARCMDLGLKPRDQKGRFQLLDTLHIDGKGTFIYNEEPFLDPDLLDRQNFLEIDMAAQGGDKHYYKEYYVERSYRTLSNLGVFLNISPSVKLDPENPKDPWVVVSYDLMPLQKQSFRFAPRLSNTNGILGINGEISYSNKNLFRGAQQLQISFVGGMESQPLIVGADENGGVSGQQLWQLNTFEWGPKISLTFPKLIFPLPKKLQEGISKRAYPKTIFDVALNYQRRNEFKRALFVMGYQLQYQQDKVQKWEFDMVKIDFVRLDKEDFFQERLEQLNDPFLLNSYTDHFTTTFSPTWHFSNLNSNRRKRLGGKHLHDVTASVDVSGWMFTPLIYNGLESLGASFTAVNAETGLKEFYGVPYTEFLKLDLQYIASIHISQQRNLVFRALAGYGLATGNSPSLPYEKAFFAGGSNDIRAFQARTMAPGSVKTYADSNSTETQIGDMRFELNAEWRFQMTSMLEGAWFVDAGNIWNRQKEGIDADDPSVFKLDSWREIAVGVGYGIRADFDFLVVRLDLAWALHNPHLPAGERWWLTGDKTSYKSYFEYNETTGEYIDYELPHPLRFNFGIGYPF